MTIQTVSTITSVFAASVSVSASGNSNTSFQNVFAAREKQLVQSEQSLQKGPPKESDDLQEAKQTDTGNEVFKNGSKPEDVTADKRSEESSEIKDMTTEEPEEQTQLYEDLITLAGQVITILQELLQVTEAQIEEAATELQLQPTDLFQPDHLKQLFLTLSGAESEQLLTDEGLYQKLVDLQESFSSLIEDGGLDFAELSLDSITEKLSEYLLGKNTTESDTPMESPMKEVVIHIQGEENVELNRLNEMSGSNKEISEIGSESKVPVSPDTEQESFHREGDNHAQTEGGQAAAFLHRLAEAAVKESSGTGVSVTFQDIYDIAGQIINQVKISIRPDSTSMEIQLYPEQLGKVDLQVTSKNGVMTAQLTTRNEIAKEAIESQMQILRETMETQGLKVDTIEVTVAEFGFRQNEGDTNGQAQQQGHHRSHRVFTEEIEDEIMINDMTEALKEINGNSVDYVA